MLGEQQIKARIATARPAEARRFYAEVLGLRVLVEHEFAILRDGGGTRVHLQKVDAFTPQPFTALGWTVADLREVAARLAARGVVFEQFEGMAQDDLGVWTPPGSGHGVCWFKDPDGNLLSLSG